jgi:DNA-binding CsgD family transcriptional regulator/Tfp pilus assembly protein PilF
VATAFADRVAAGGAALARGDWAAARSEFEAVLAEEEIPEALEGLARACWWLDDVATVSDARERAYRMYRERGDVSGSARVATQLARQALLERGDQAVFNGWTERARRLLDGVDECPGHAVLAVHEAHFLYLAANDAEAARVRAAVAAELARRFGLVDLEMLALAIEGAALVSAGKVDEGMSILNASTAAAVGGEVGDVEMLATTCCFLIFACERLRDFDRAAQWCTQMKDFCGRSGMPALFAVCRTHYATVLTERGEWREAETELADAMRIIANRPPPAAEAITRLGDLRRRQGRRAEATELFDRVSFHPRAQLGHAELALDVGDAEAACDWAARFLRRVPESDRLQRALGLDVAVRARAAFGDVEGARAALAELRETVEASESAPLAASLAFAEGVVEEAAGALESARGLLEEAVDRFEHAVLPFQAAEARAALARVLRGLGRGKAAEREAAQAERALERLGARRPSDGELSRREQEVLQLVAEGLSDRQIAERLVLSPHTVHRHVSNILLKLGLSSRAAAAVHAARRGLL